MAVSVKCLEVCFKGEVSSKETLHLYDIEAVFDVCEKIKDDSSFKQNISFHKFRIKLMIPISRKKNYAKAIR